MKEKYDELQNKFIDNDLSNEEIKKVNELLEDDNDFRENLEVMQSVHKNLSRMSVDNAPLGITDKIMARIELTSRVFDSNNYFFKTIILFFSSLFILGIFFLLYILLGIDLSNVDFSSTSKIVSSIKPITEFISNFTSTNTFKMVTVFVGFIILISFYFQLGSFTEFKNRLNNY